MNAGPSDSLDRQIDDAQRAIDSRDERVRREMDAMLRRAQSDGSRALIAAGAVGVVLLALRRGFRRAPRIPAPGAHRGASGLAWIGPLALAVLRSPLTAYWVSRHARAEEAERGAHRAGSHRHEY